MIYVLLEEVQSVIYFYKNIEPYFDIKFDKSLYFIFCIFFFINNFFFKLIF